MFFNTACLLCFTLTLTSAANSNLATCSCEVAKDYLIIFDEHQPMEALWNTQVFVSKLARRLRGINAGNRVAVGVFTEIKSSLEESEFRKDHAFEQAILDLDLYPAAISVIDNCVSVAKSEIDKAKSGNLVTTLFIVASKGLHSGEDEEIEKRALSLSSDYKRYVGHAIGIGTNFHENTLKALSVSGKYWKINNADELSSIELKVEVDLCSSAPKNRWNKFPTVSVSLYEYANHKGTSLDIEMQENQCVDIGALPEYWESKNIQSKSNWKGKVESVQTSGCITAWEQAGCEGKNVTIKDHSNFKSGLDFNYHYMSLCKENINYKALYNQ